jgi:nucleoprotein TPR
MTTLQYDRIDPAEMQSLKDDIEQLKKEKSEVDAAVSDLQTQVQERTQRVSPSTI